MTSFLTIAAIDLSATSKGNTKEEFGWSIAARTNDVHGFISTNLAVVWIPLDKHDTQVS